MNLVDNALTHGGGTVELGAERRDGLVELHVSDAGPGFPLEFRDRAFDRFSRADGARSGGGTGLGLSIVELVASAHGGAVGVGELPIGWRGRLDLAPSGRRSGDLACRAAGDGGRVLDRQL